MNLSNNVVKALALTFQCIRNQRDLHQFLYSISRPTKGFHDFFINVTVSPVQNKTDDSLPSKRKRRYGILIQGPVVKANRFTYYTIELYKNLYPDAIIVLSTWKDMDVSELKGDQVHIILNEYPEEETYKNTNKMMKSINAGLEYFQKLDVDFVLRTRSDQRIQAGNCFDYFFGLLDMFPLDSNILNQKCRLITLNMWTAKYVPYAISDIFQFGHIDDMIDYWDIQRQVERYSKVEKKYVISDLEKICPETVLGINFAQKKLESDFEYTLKSYYKMLAKRFIVIDYLSIGLLWEKFVYNSMSYYKKQTTTLMMHKDWFLLNRNEIDMDAIDENNKILPFVD